MNTAWFVLLGGLLIGYAILDGIDLGVGALHLTVGKSDGERRTHLNAIGPLWTGYEVWLVVAGGSMVTAFPKLYAASFSGFYLVLMLTLWLLIGRGAAIEFRSHVANPLWRGFWDFAFCGSSLLLSFLFGAAVGNVIRGVPLDSQGFFLGSFALTLNPYALLVGLLSVVLLAMHGANFLASRTDGAHRARARLWGRRLWYAVAALLIAATFASFRVRESLGANFGRYPFLFFLPMLAAGALTAIAIFQRRGRDGHAGVAGAVLIGAVMATAGASLYPLLLPVLGHPSQGLTVFNAAAPRYNLEVAFAVNVIAMSGIIAYHVFIHRLFRHTAKVGDDEHGYE